MSDPYLTNSVVEKFENLAPPRIFLRLKHFAGRIEVFANWTTMHCHRTGGHGGRPLVVVVSSYRIEAGSKQPITKYGKIHRKFRR